MATLKELLTQQAALATQIEEMRHAEHADAIAKVKALIAENGLTKSDIFGATRAPQKTKAKVSKVAAKYRDPASGKEWSGRGIAPKWLDKDNKAKFLIA